MTILSKFKSAVSKVKTTVKKVASGIKSGAQNAARGNFSNLSRNVSNVTRNLKQPAAVSRGIKPLTNQQVISAARTASSLKNILTSPGIKWSPTTRGLANVTNATGSKTQPLNAQQLAKSTGITWSTPTSSLSKVRPSSASAGITFTQPTNFSFPTTSTNAVRFGSDTNESISFASPGASSGRIASMGAGFGFAPSPSGTTDTNQTNESRKNIDFKNLPFAQNAGVPLSTLLSGFESGALRHDGGPVLQAPKVPSTIQSNQLGITPQDVLARRDQMGGTAGSLASMQATLENAKAMLDQYKAQQDALYPPVPEPIEDTEEQMAWLDQFAEEDKINVREELDRYKQDIGLTQVTAQRLDIMKQLNATNEVYQKIIDDIKGNPELPASLAQRRMNEAYEQQKGIILQLTGQYNLLVEQENMLNDQVNQRFQILKDARSEQDAKEKRLYDILNFMVEGGSISAMTDSELKAISQRLGVPLSALKDVRAQTLKERATDGQKTTIYSTDQGLVALTQDSYGNVIKTVNVLPKAGGGTTYEPWKPSRDQLGKLEAAGLSGASRQEQLDYLYNSEDDGPVNPFRR